MATELSQKVKTYEVRARMPGYFRVAAVVIIGLTVVALIIGFYRERSRSPFRLKSEHTQLSTDVVAEVTGYHRTETDGGDRKYAITADRAKTFSDNHQEFENVSFELFGDGGNSDKLSADRGLYVPDENKDFTAYLSGNVDIQTRDALRVRTSNVVFTKHAEAAEADELVEFERENIKGRAFGANIRIGEKRLELFRDVEFDIDSPQGSQKFTQSAIRAGSATFDQAVGTLDARDRLSVTLSGPSLNTELRSDRAVVALGHENENGVSVRSLELFDNVWIENREHGARQYTIESGYANYQRPSERFTLRHGAHIVSGESEPVDMRSDEAVFEQSSGKVRLTGGAEISRGTSFLKSDSLSATLNGGKLKDALLTGSAYMRTNHPERTAEIRAGEISLSFDEAQTPRRAQAEGEPRFVMIPAQTVDVTQTTLSAARTIDVVFKPGGFTHIILTKGRTTIGLEMLPNGVDSANKQLTADTMNVTFEDTGKYLRSAEATGSGELVVYPHQAAVQNYRTTIFSPRFECDFFATGNNAQLCKARRRVKAVRELTVPRDGHGTQTLTSDELLANFNETTGDIDTLTASGSAKFSELDRSATASVIAFTQSDKTARLRGGEPTAWDGASRVKAREIDWNTAERRSLFRGGVSTTYQSRKAMGDSVPFSESAKPVYATADSADFDHNTDVALYTGNARGWQGDNYVRANQFTIFQREGRFFAEGSVQSLLYDTKAAGNHPDRNVPVSASSNSLNYLRDSRLLQYRQNVDVRQGTDRLTAETADIYLNDENELVRSVAENNVVMTQPGRKAVGDWLQYTAADEMAVVRGNPARIDDAASGTSQGGQLSVYLKDNRVVSEGRTRQNKSGRTRSVYKVSAAK